MKRIKEETRENLPMRLALVYELRQNDYIPKHNLAFICACKYSSISSALSELRTDGYRITMTWHRPTQCWAYNIKEPK